MLLVDFLNYVLIKFPTQHLGPITGDQVADGTTHIAQTDYSNVHVIFSFAIDR
jgi:hypothetical protein